MNAKHPIFVVSDNIAKLAGLRGLLAGRHVVTSSLLGSKCQFSRMSETIVVAADLRHVESIKAIKEGLSEICRLKKRIFLVDERSHRIVAQAYALGATHVLLSSIDQQDLFECLGDEDEPSSSKFGGGPKEIAAASAAQISKMFAAVSDGRCIDVRGAEDAANNVAEIVGEDGLSAWIETVRRHHEGTYQHCLLVTGVAVDFGLSLGVPAADIKRIASAAMFHDIGKARIPLAVLDKAGSLDRLERALIETHPAAGYEILKATGQSSWEVLDAVRHHHEYLDGSGYPDSLSGSSISDIVRLLTVSDIFSALIEDRRYKPCMPREKAYGIICNMPDKLEQPLVAAFKDVALSR